MPADVKARMVLDVGNTKTGKYPIHSVQCSIHQPTDQAGKASAPTRPDPINVTKEATDDTSFADWASNDNDNRSGTVTIFDPSMSQTMRTIKFTDGFISQYESYCNAEAGSQMIESFTITAKEVTIGSVPVKHVGA
jgi:hypothetical protein